MKQTLGNNGSAMVRGNWDWLPQKRKEQYGHITFSAVNLEARKEYVLLIRIAVYMDNTLLSLMDAIKKIKIF